MLTAKLKFVAAVPQEPKILVTAVQLPSGAIEVITNTNDLMSKIDYIFNAYNDDMELKTNKEVKIVGWMIV